MIFINQLLGYLDIPGYLCRKIGFMKKNKPYKEQEPIQQKASESFVAYSKIDLGIATRERDNIKSAISGEELLDRLRPRIKALFK